MHSNDPSIMGNLFGQTGKGTDRLGENGSVTFGGADAGDIYYNGAAVAVMPLQAAAAAIELVSDSAEDNVGGTGALTVKISGLDGDYKWVSETLTMTGAAAVVGEQLFLRTLDIRVMTVGTHETNVGNIDCQAVGAGQVWDRIVADEGLNQHSLITVPAGKTFWAVDYDFSSNALVTQEFRVVVRRYGGAWVVVGKRYTYFGGTVGHMAPMQVPSKFPEKTDIKMHATVGGAASVSSHMHGFLTDN